MLFNKTIFFDSRYLRNYLCNFKCSKMKLLINLKKRRYLQNIGTCPKDLKNKRTFLKVQVFVYIQISWSPSENNTRGSGNFGDIFTNPGGYRKCPDYEFRVNITGQYYSDKPQSMPDFENPTWTNKKQILFSSHSRKGSMSDKQTNTSSVRANIRIFLTLQQVSLVLCTR